MKSMGFDKSSLLLILYAHISRENTETSWELPPLRMPVENDDLVQDHLLKD